MMKQWTKRTPPQIDSTTKYCILLYRDALEERRRKKRRKPLFPCRKKSDLRIAVFGMNHRRIGYFSTWICASKREAGPVS